MVLTHKKVFFIMVLHPAGKWVRVGNSYPSSEAAREWVPFVRGAWRGLRVKVRPFTIELQDGHISEKSKKELDEVFNLDV